MSADPYLLFAVVTGTVALTLAGALVFLILVLRARQQWRESHERRFTEIWRPLLLEAIVDPSAHILPDLRPRDRLNFLKLWNYLQESMRGEASKSLNNVARRLACHKLAQRMLHRGCRAERLLAIVTLGNLREPEAWLDLLCLVRSKDTVTSLIAARALIQIDPKTAAEFLMPWILVRQDWEIARVVRMMTDAGAAFARPLTRSVGGARANELLRALQLIAAMRLQLPRAAIRHLLDRRQTPQVLAATLPLVVDSHALWDQVRRHSGHGSWRVRDGAVQVLGRLGAQSDVALLTVALGDPQWWVRYHAADALAGIAGVGQAALARLQASTTDPAMLQILLPVLAERSTPSHFI